ncbi:MAG: hypothetical protein PHG81_06825 [Aliarcobacter sp.]|nr:hypothetical protein [Aliarcobacter sp.]
MKRLLIVTISLTGILFANYNYTDDNAGKIDMHGGKSDTLVPSSFGNMNIQKPIAPIAPKQLIEKEEKKLEEKITEKKEISK